MKICPKCGITHNNKYCVCLHGDMKRGMDGVKQAQGKFRLCMAKFAEEKAIIYTLFDCEAAAGQKEIAHA